MAWESLHSRCLRVSWAPVLGLYEGIFELWLIIFLMNEKSIGNPTWQVWIVLVETVGANLGTNLEGRCGGMCANNLGSHYGFVSFKKLWAIVQGLSLCSHPKSGLPWSFKSHVLLPLVYTHALKTQRIFIHSTWVHKRNPISFKHIYFWSLFLAPYLSTYHSSITVQWRWEAELGPLTSCEHRIPS
jgi:hypothetical protein